MKKLLGIVVLGLLWSTPSFSFFNTYLKCTCYKTSLINLNKNPNGECSHIEYFRINSVMNTIEYGWDVRDQKFSTKKKLKEKNKSTYKYRDGSSNVLNVYQYIDRETGKARHRRGFYNCEKIDKLPVKNIKQKF